MEIFTLVQCLGDQSTQSFTFLWAVERALESANIHLENEK